MWAARSYMQQIPPALNTVSEYGIPQDCVMCSSIYIYVNNCISCQVVNLPRIDSGKCVSLFISAGPAHVSA